MAGVFGGKPKKDASLQAMQARQMAEEQRRRAELEGDKARVAGGASQRRRGRAMLSSAGRGLKSALGA